MIYNKLASYYDLFVDEQLNDVYINLIKKYFTSGRVADLGCGTGQLAISLAKQGYFVTASDISEKMLEVAYNNSILSNVNINFFVHDILEPLNLDSDIIIMASDVINYLDNEAAVIKAFEHVKEIMHDDSIYLFDFLKTSYVTSLIGYHEEVELEDAKLTWKVLATKEKYKIKHYVTINDSTEIHFQRTYVEKAYEEMCNKAMLQVAMKVELEDRIIFICKKDV